MKVTSTDKNLFPRALIGATMVDGGIPKALQCLQFFLPELYCMPFETRQADLFKRAPDVDLPAPLQPLEGLIGYTFKKKAFLVEAMTHGSYKSGSQFCQSLERLEFLGDAVLDYIVDQAMYQEAKLSHVDMHHLRTSLVNADYLAFICMEWSIEHDIIDLEPDISSLDENVCRSSRKTLERCHYPYGVFSVMDLRG